MTAEQINALSKHLKTLSLYELRFLCDDGNAMVRSMASDEIYLRRFGF